MEENTRELKERFGTIESILNYLISKNISFPYQKTYLPSPKKMMEHMKSSINVILTDPFECSVPRPNFLDCKFSGEYKSIYSAYTEFDSISDHFCEEERVKAHHGDSKSPKETWEDSNLHRRILHKSLCLEKINSHNLRDLLFHECNEARQFRPSWFRGIIEILYPNLPSLRILDISAGWGDRLIGAISLNSEYLGFDPNTNLKPCYERIISELGDSNLHTVKFEPFEDSDLTSYQEYFDVCLSSPPFFDLEKYCDQETQSNIRYPEIEQWKQNFLYKSITKAWNSIKKGGYLAIHIVDTKKTAICYDLYKYVEKHHFDAAYMGMIGIISKGNAAVPVWIWRKFSSMDN